MKEINDQANIKKIAIDLIENLLNDVLSMIFNKFICNSEIAESRTTNFFCRNHSTR
ncbi:MAG: hypothetical protein JW776_14480 [Candidatus Lokiarchaeota archaeon]|nr:hypothetical protein [Candidatus Lokiarchaeota archaeon]